jgi:adenylyltransferase/sulfurtransferase
MTQEEQERYERQLSIEGWGEAGQEKLRGAEVMIAGLGGLGAPVAYYLAAAGVGRLRLWDRDTVTRSNLNRQILYTGGDEGRRKVDAAAERLGQLNPLVAIEPIDGEISRESLAAHSGNADLIVDCLDNFETRFLLNEFAVARRIPLVHGGVRGLHGQVTVVKPGEGPCLECLFSGMKSESGTPVLGAAVGVIGCMSAVEALKLLTGIGKPLAGRLLIFNGLQGDVQQIEVAREPACPVCGAG